MTVRLFFYNEIACLNLFSISSMNGCALESLFSDTKRFALSMCCLAKSCSPFCNCKPAKLYRKNDEEGQDIWFIGSGGSGNGLKGQTVSYSQNNGQLRKAQNRIDGRTEREILFTFDKGEKRSTT